MNALARLRCFLRARHVPARYLLGGFKCSECGVAGVDLREMGFDSGYVSPWRRIYSRDERPASRARNVERG